MVAFLLLLLFTAPDTGKWRLPAQARITRETAHNIYATDIIPDCAKRHITEAALRRKFAIYHELREMEYHDGYQQVGCVVEGDIFVGGKHFRYTDQPINLLWTTWPDGKPHQLGGRHSDESYIQ